MCVLRVSFEIKPENDETVGQLTDLLTALFRDSGVDLSIKPLSGFTIQIAAEDDDDA